MTFMLIHCNALSYSAKTSIKTSSSCRDGNTEQQRRLQLDPKGNAPTCNEYVNKFSISL